MEELIKQAIADQNAILEDSIDKTNELSEAYVDGIRHPWKGTVSNIKEAVQAIKTIGDDDDEADGS